MQLIIKTTNNNTTNNQSIKKVKKKKKVIVEKWKMIRNDREEKDEVVEKIIDEYCMKFDIEMKEEIATIHELCSLSSLGTRKRETTFGNLVTDAVRQAYGEEADLCFINGGFIRGNREYQPDSALTLNDIFKELPFPRHCLMLSLTTEDLWEALEAGVRAVEESLGFFPQLSKDWKMEYDPKKEKGKRIQKLYYKNEEINLEKNRKRRWNVVVTEYMAKGGDGFYSLKKGEALKNVMDSKTVCELVTNFITKEKVVCPVLEQRSVSL